MSTDNPTAKLQALKEEAEARAAKAAEEAQAREIEALELEAKFAETGKQGVDWEIVRTRLGPFVVKVGEYLAHKRLDAKGKDLSIEDAIGLVLPALLHPPRDTAAAVFQKHGGIAWACALAMRNLFSAAEEERSGKA